MDIKIVDQDSDLSRVVGLVVVIDVIRAFTTACYCFSRGAERILTIADIEDARRIKKQHKNWLLIGERAGLKLADFDYGNSPSEIRNVDLSGKTVILTTSSGTQVIGRLPKANKIITGAFVNAEAIISYIHIKEPAHVTFVCTDNRWEDNEDFQLAKYLSNRLAGLEVNFLEIKSNLYQHPTAQGFIHKPLTKFSADDFEMCLELDKFKFVNRVNESETGFFLEKVDIVV